MTAHPLFNKIAGNVAGALISLVLIANAYAAPTPLATEPFLSSSAKVKALPNIMFTLDDSGSMQLEHLPDWAGPYQQLDGNGVLTTVTPRYRFFNNAYNGVAYNPGTYYRPPVMYASDGSLTTTVYPSQTGNSVAEGGDASATSASPNWRAVKSDGFGVQSTATANLEGNASFYVSTKIFSINTISN
ncbi:MAG: hypothetical protein WCL27_17760 [Betaproteobacteria bacterium]